MDIKGQVLDLNVCVCVCLFEGADLFTQPRAEVRTLRVSFSALNHKCVCVGGVGACMLVCVWYTELTCIPYRA